MRMVKNEKAQAKEHQRQGKNLQMESKDLTHQMTRRVCKMQIPEPVCMGGRCIILSINVSVNEDQRRRAERRGERKELHCGV